jgi:hypothetical protein
VVQHNEVVFWTSDSFHFWACHLLDLYPLPPTDEPFCRFLPSPVLDSPDRLDHPRTAPLTASKMRHDQKGLSEEPIVLRISLCDSETEWNSSHVTYIPFMVRSCQDMRGRLTYSCTLHYITLHYTMPFIYFISEFTYGERELFARQNSKENSEYQTARCGDKNPDLYSGGTRFISHWCYLVSWLLSPFSLSVSKRLRG